MYWLGLLLLMFLSGAENRASCSPALRSMQALSAGNSTQPLSWLLSSHRKLLAHGSSTFCVRAGRYSVLLLKPGRQFSPRLNFLVHPEAFYMNRTSVEAS